MGDILFALALIGWVVSGFVGAGWLMLKGYGTDMLGCLGILYGGPLVLMAFFGPIMLLIAWSVPSRTDPAQEGGFKRTLKSSPKRSSAPTSGRAERPSKPSRPLPTRRRPELSGHSSRESRQRAIPDRPSGRASSRRPPKPPKSR